MLSSEFFSNVYSTIYQIPIFCSTLVRLIVPLQFLEDERLSKKMLFTKRWRKDCLTYNWCVFVGLATWFGMRKRFRQQGCNKSSCAPWGQKYNSNPHGGSNISNATISLLLLQRALGILVGAEKMVMKSGIRKERSYNSKMAKTDITLITRGVHFELQVAPRVGAWWNVSRGGLLTACFSMDSRWNSCWTLKLERKHLKIGSS